MLRVDRHDDAERGCRLVEIALCNDRETPRKIPVDAWLYQTKLTVDRGRGGRVPAGHRRADGRPATSTDDEVRRLNLQYRDRLEFAVGRTCSVGWAGGPSGARRASARSGRPGCRCARRRRSPPMRSATRCSTCGSWPTATPGASCGPGCRRSWTSTARGSTARRRGPSSLPEHLRDEGLDAVSEARKVQRQLADGLEHLLGDADALRCFRFMNEVMADQRVQSQVARRRAQHPEESIDEARDAVLAEADKPHSWCTFQLAFILMQLPLLTDPAADKRSGDLAKAQLLFFPTGGGKTEAYLGLAAYAFAIRRLQGVVETAGRAARRRAGVTVLMRYTLRLLTAQQFQRATALVCAAEMARRARRGDVGHRAVPDRAVGRDRREPEAVRGGRGAAQAGQRLRRRLPADRAAVPALPLVRHADQRGAT